MFYSISVIKKFEIVIKRYINIAEKPFYIHNFCSAIFQLSFFKRVTRIIKYNCNFKKY